MNTKLFDKRDAFGFSILNFPDLAGHILINTAMLVSQLIRYARRRQHMKDVVDHTKLVIDTLPYQGFKRFKKNSIEHYELFFKYNVPSTSMFCDLC